MRLLLAIVVSASGCDKLFGLDHVSFTPDAPSDASGDAALPACERGYPSVPLVEVPMNAYQATSGDFNGDGKIDLAVTGTGGNSVAVMLGKGDGTFTQQRLYAARANPYALASGDVNGDTHIDLVVANDAGASAGQFSVLLGNGDGTFAAPVNTSPVGVQPRGIALGDIDGDKNVDVVVANYGSNNVSIYLGAGDGSFTTTPAKMIGNEPFGIVLADFNEDTKLDIATANFGEAMVGLLINTTTTAGTPAFASLVKQPAGTGSIGLAAADLDDKGHVDLAVANQTANTVSILLGNGNATFSPAAPYPVGVAPRALAIMDVDHDGPLDVLVGDLGQNSGGTIVGDGQLSMLRGAGGGGFAAEVRLPTVNGPSSLVVADIDGDTHPDLAALSRDAGFVQILLSRGASFPLPRRLAVPGAFGAALADLDGDGRLDIAVASNSANAVDVFLSTGDFGAATVYTAGPGPRETALADLDGDQILDLLTVHYNAGGAGSLWYRKGNGDGTFATTPVTKALGAGQTALATGDFDLDGDTDVVVTDYSDSTLQILRNNGGTLTAEAEFGMGGNALFDVAVADFDDDGHLDLIATSQSSNVIGVRRGLANNTFAAPVVHNSLDQNPYNLVVSDLDHNGKLDVAVANYTSGTIGVLAGNGDGTFATVGTVPTTSLAWGIDAADFDGDGVLDLITTSYDRGVATIVLGTGDGNFGAPRSYATGLGSTAAQVADLDGDGFADIAVSNLGGGSLTLIYGSCVK